MRNEDLIPLSVYVVIAMDQDTQEFVSVVGVYASERDAQRAAKSTQRSDGLECSVTEHVVSE